MRYFIVFLLFFIIHNCVSQNERSIARDGNKYYDKGLFSDSEINYRKSLSQKKSFKEAQFNLSNALFKQERYDESINLLNDLISNTDNLDLKSASYYNLGNNFLQQQKLEEAIDAYKNCLRITPSDEQARYNLAKAISLMQQQENQDQNEENQDQNEESQNQNSGETDSQDDSDDQQDAKNNKDANTGNDQGSKNQNQDSNEKNQDSEGVNGQNLSKSEIERILDALEREEQKVQEEMQKRQQKGKQKLLEKDW